MVAAASRCPLAAGLALELLPIVEDGLFGYELSPELSTHTYLIIGCNAQGQPMLRRTSYGNVASDALQLATLDGRVLSRTERAARHGSQQRDSNFPDWTAAADSAFAQLHALLPGRPRRPVAIRQYAHRCLDEALAVAHSYLADWDPCIHFLGLPDEAQHGFALRRGKDEHGELLFQRPDIWMLRWKGSSQSVYESWSVVLPDLDAADTPKGDFGS